MKALRPPADASLPFSTSVASTTSYTALTDVTHQVANVAIGMPHQGGGGLREVPGQQGEPSRCCQE